MALGRWMLDPVGRLQMEQRWVQVEGHQMHCLTAGEGPDLILIHGLLGTASTWEPVIPRLAQESTVYAIDALGIGESERVLGIDATLKPRRIGWSRLWTPRRFAQPTSLLLLTAGQWS